MNLETILLLAGSLLGVAATAFFTSAETALISCDKVTLGKLKKRGSKRAILAARHLENVDRLLTTTQFGANLSIATASTCATLAFGRLFPHHELLAFLVFTPLVLIFSDSLPKILGRHNPDTISLRVSYPLAVFGGLLSPLTGIIGAYTARLSDALGVGRQDAISRRKKAREELQSLLTDMDHESEIRLGHRRMIRKILEFNQNTVKKVMLPLVNVDAIDRTRTVEEAVELFETLRHSRLPVYDERVDNIVGVLHFQDVFSCRDPKDTVEKYMKPALFVPEIQQLDSLTKEMRAQDTSLAVAVDEYGGAVGIVTKEDVLEEIVGDISDEFDEHTLSILEISEKTWLVHVNVEIAEVNERIGISIPKGEYETLSGFLLQQFNRIPQAGDELFYGKLKFRVHRATERSIETVVIHLEEAP
ncbi:MAG: HlyC/CorC family transporter [Bdellovibrionales bacterium]|nr:HlyC/CorC family transporter [Bdellovibrionales bacterium]